MGGSLAALGPFTPANELLASQALWKMISVGKLEWRWACADGGLVNGEKVGGLINRRHFLGEGGGSVIA